MRSQLTILVIFAFISIVHCLPAPQEDDEMTTTTTSTTTTTTTTTTRPRPSLPIFNRPILGFITSSVQAFNSVMSTAESLATSTMQAVNGTGSSIAESAAAFTNQVVDSAIQSMTNGINSIVTTLNNLNNSSQQENTTTTIPPMQENTSADARENEIYRFRFE